MLGRGCVRACTSTLNFIIFIFVNWDLNLIENMYAPIIIIHKPSVNVTQSNNSTSTRYTEFQINCENARITMNTDIVMSINGVDE